MTPPADDVPDRLGNVALDSATENSCCRLQDTTHQEPSSFESDPSNHGISATLQPREAQQFHDTPLDRVLAAKEELSNNLTPVAKLADQQPNAGGSGNLGEDFRQQIFDSYPYRANARNKYHHGSAFARLFLAACDSAGSAFSLLLPTRRPSTDSDVELGYNSDDSDNPNPYSLEADVQSPEGWVEGCVVSTDTGSEGDFLFLSALDKIGPLDKVIFPIPPRKLKRYVNPFDPSKEITPLYYVNLPLRNRSVGLNHTIKLKLLDVPEGTNGYDIVLGHNAIDGLGDPNFLAKVKNANADGPRLAANHGGNNLFGALLKVKKSKKKQLADKANDDKLRERDNATSTKLYATSGVDMQPSATPSWGETSQRAQGPSASFPNSATWHTSAQQPFALASRPNYGSLTEQQTAPNHSPPVPDYRGDFASHRADTFSSQFTQNTQFSACSSGSTAASSISSWSTVTVDAGKRAGYAADYAVPQESAHSVDQQKQ